MIAPIRTDTPMTSPFLVLASLGLALGQPAKPDAPATPPAGENAPDAGAKAADASTPANAKPSLDLLKQRLTGSFASTEQSAADPENYFDIRLHMAPIWTERSDGPWLYVEQATAQAPDRPYRQRIYRLSEPTPGTYRSEVYTLPDNKTAIGAWSDPAKLKDLSPEKLTLRDGCALELSWKEGAFVGATKGQSCASDLRGAKYATSEATILADRLITWDRGYDTKGEQVWGATKGGYVFKRIQDPK